MSVGGTDRRLVGYCKRIQEFMFIYLKNIKNRKKNLPNNFAKLFARKIKI